MNEKDDDEIELNRSLEKNEEDDIVIDDIDAFINGAYDKNTYDKDLYTKEKSFSKYENKYCVDIDGEEYDFYANSIEIALLSAWNYNGYLYVYDENGEKEMIYTPFEDACINNVKLAAYGIYVNENDDGFYWTNNKKIIIDGTDYIKFF
jgi:hypothetical protein